MAGNFLSDFPLKLPDFRKVKMLSCLNLSKEGSYWHYYGQFSGLLMYGLSSLVIRVGPLTVYHSL